MSTYVISDIHGQYDLFLLLLDLIDLKDDDVLYILGDVLDRGPHPVKTMLKLMEMPNVICIAGNHELMAIECLDVLTQEITEASIEKLDRETLDNILNWQYNGSRTTLMEFRELDRETQHEMMEFIKDFDLYAEVTAGGRDYVLVHAGLGNFSPEKELWEYSLHELIWTRPDYNEQYYPDKYVVTGHTPTRFIEENPRPDRIFRNKNHIAIDCGANIPGGRLAAICLDTDEEFYVDNPEKG